MAGLFADCLDTTNYTSHVINEGPLFQCMQLISLNSNPRDEANSNCFVNYLYLQHCNY